VLHGQWDWGDQTRNVFHFGGDDALVANGQTVVDSLLDIIMQATTLFVDDYEFTGATFYQIETPGVPGTFYTPTGGSIVGTGAGDPLAGQIALLMNFWAVTARPNRKRTYLAGMGEGAITDGLWNGSQLDAGDLVVADLLDFDTESGIDARLGAFAYLTPPDEQPALNYLTQGRTEQVPATQRRRRRGTGI
jgi:hypothetical protein